MKQFLLYLTLLPMLSKAQNPKLMVNGEHLEYKMDYYDEDYSYETNVSQGEKWFAVYTNSNKFEVKEETISWDTTQNFTFASDTSVQPVFYFQGFQPIKEGVCADVSSLIWTFQNKKYCIINKSDTMVSKINAGNITEIILNVDTFLIYSGVKSKSINGRQLLVMWAGDINGDDQLDFVLRSSYPDTVMYDFIISNKIENKIEWKRIARFHEWS